MNKIYVSTTGKDANNGRLEMPIATLKRANELAKSGTTIILREGTHILDSSFEISNLSDIVITSYENENVRITGSITLDFNKFELYKSSILKFDLKGNGITSYGELKSRGFRRPYVNAPMELFINTEPMELAKSKPFLIGEVLDTGSIPAEDDFSNRGGTFKYSDDNVSNWANTDDIWLTGYFRFTWADDTIKIESIDTENKTITLQSPHLFGIESGEHNKVCAVNLPQELVKPGRYYIDRQKGILYYYPVDNFNGNDEISVSIMDEPMFCLMDCNNITIKNITLEMFRGIGIYIEGGNGNIIDNCIIRNAGVVAVCMGKGIKSDTMCRHNFTGEPISKEIGSWHEHIYDNPAFDRNAGKNHIIKNCHIYNCGTGGISMGGGDRVSLTPANNEVYNCEIHHCNRYDKMYKACINIDGVGNKITHCLLHDAAGSAIYLHGNDHIMEYNEIHNVCLEADDGGAFYIGRDPSERGNLLQYNYFHHIPTPHKPDVPLKNGCGTFAIYNDDGACGTTILSNIFYKAGSWTIISGGGSDITIDNNIFVQSQAAIVQGDTLMRGVYGFYDKDKMPEKGSLLYHRLLESVDVTKPPYTTKYPSIANFFADRGKPSRNTARYNVVYECLNFIIQRHYDEYLINDTFIKKEGETEYDVYKSHTPWYEQKENIITANCPFENDTTFEINKNVLAAMPSFKQIPFNKIGLIKEKNND